MDLLSWQEDSHEPASSPLADRMRPRTLEEFIGQEHLLGQGRLLRRAIEADRLISSIFYGPPGCGKTTLAAIVARTSRAALVQMNAVAAGVSEMREVLKNAEERRRQTGQGTLLLLDECHRWNKAQSDSLLPAIERGVIRFIGSTTENPMITMTPAIVSRCRVFQFLPLTDSHVIQAMKAALADRERGYGALQVEAEAAALTHIARVAGGDVRSALNALELAVLTTPMGADGVIRIDAAVAAESIQQPVLRMDDTLYYDMLSAFCKSLRGCATDAALAWFARMIYAGVDPKIIVRRIIAHASEDVGMANPMAMLLAAAAATALDTIGMPEAKLPISQAIIALCESPKSNSVVMAIDEAMADAKDRPMGEVPLHLRDTHYAGHQRLDNGKGYQYPHDYPGHYIQQQYMPEDVRGRRYYEPSDQGAEDVIRRRKAAREKNDTQWGDIQ